VSIRISANLQEVAARLQTSDFEGVLSVLGEAYADDGPLPFTGGVLERLAELLRCEYATYMELDFLPRVVRSYTGCRWDPYLPDGQHTDAYWDELEVRRRPTHPSGIATASDARDAPFRGPLHDEMFETLRLRDELTIALDTPATERVVLVFHSVERTFGERERLVALTLKPHVASLDRNARARRQLAALLLALRRGEEDGSAAFVLLGRAGAVDYASAPACRLAERWFGGLEGGRRPSQVADWLRSPRPRPPLELIRDGRRLVVESPGDEALLLTEETPPAVSLTPRERDVLRCVAAGKSSAQTARLLSITPATVSKHLEHVYAKLGVNSRTAALARLGMTREAA
jgi:DNA-binding CsgD family transcriptional regulator